MITITFFFDNVTGYTEKSYTGIAAALMAELDMDVHIKNGGYCMAGHGGKYVLIANSSQLTINQK